MTLTAKAGELILAELKSGQPVPVKVVAAKAFSLGISEAILKNARQRMGNVQTAHISGAWTWQLLSSPEWKRK